MLVAVLGDFSLDPANSSAYYRMVLLVASLMVVAVLMLNLFIAVLSEEYNIARQQSARDYSQLITQRWSASSSESTTTRICWRASCREHDRRDTSNGGGGTVQLCGTVLIQKAFEEMSEENRMRDSASAGQDLVPLLSKLEVTDSRQFNVERSINKLGKILHNQTALNQTKVRRQSSAPPEGGAARDSPRALVKKQSSIIAS